MLLKRTRTLVAFTLAGLTSPAWSQSYFHAPPTSSGAEGSLAEALLPIIQPGATGGASRMRSPFEGWSRDASRPQPDPSHAATTPTTTQPTASAGPRPVWIPSHLAQNRWARLDEPLAGGPSGRNETPAIAPRLVAAAPATPSSSEPNRVRSLAAEAIARGDGKTAERILAEAAEKFPSDARLVAALARARESQKDWFGAIIAYDVLEKLEPSEPRWRARRAECRYQVGQFDRAAEDFGAAAAATTLSLDEYARYADAAMRGGDPAAAQEALDRLAALGHKPMPQTELLRGLAALKQGNAEDARGILLKASAVWPKDAAITEALRVAAAAHYGDRPLAALPKSSGGLRWKAAADRKAEPTIVTTAGESGDSRVTTITPPPAPRPLSPPPAPRTLEEATSMPAPARLAETPDSYEPESLPVITPRGAKPMAKATTTRSPRPIPLVSRWRKARPTEPPAETPQPLVEAVGLELEEPVDPSSAGWRSAASQGAGPAPMLLDAGPERTAAKPVPVEAPR